MRRLVLTSVAALAIASPALAKEPKDAKICGPTACGVVTDRELLLGLMQQGGAGPSPSVGEYYKVTISLDVPEAPRFGFWWAPRSRAVRAIDQLGPFGNGSEATWVSLEPGVAEAFARAVEDVDPFPPPKISQVEVGGKPVHDPASYARLYDVKSVGDAVPNAGDWQEVRFTGTPSPWTDGRVRIEFSPKDGLLSRGSEIVKLPPSLVARIDRGASIADGGRGFPWAYALLVALALATAAAVARLVRARAPRESPDSTPRPATP